MVKKYPAYVGVPTALTLTTLYGGVATAMVMSPGGRRGVGLLFTGFMTMTFLTSARTTFEIMRSRWALPSEEVEVKPSH